MQLDSLIWETASPRTHKSKIVNESLNVAAIDDEPTPDLHMQNHPIIHS